MGYTAQLSSSGCITLTTQEIQVAKYENDGFMGEDDKDNADFHTEDAQPRGQPLQSSESYTGPEETAWSWLVCFACFLIYFIVLGIQTSFGLIFDQFLIDFKRSHSETAWIGSIANWGLVFFGGIANFLCQQLDPGTVAIIGALISATGILASSFVTTFELFYLTYSLASGFGASLAYTTVVLVVSNFFSRKRDLALGLATAGSSSGTMVMNTVFHFLIQRYGWRASLRVSSLMCIAILPCGLITKRRGRDRHEDEIKESNINPPSKDMTCLANTFGVMSSLFFDLKLLKSKLIVIWLLTMVFSNFGYYIPHTYLILYSKSIGVTPAKASQLFVFFGIFSTIGRIFWGLFSQMRCVNTKVLMFTCIFSMGAMNFFFTAGTQYYYLATFMSIYGFLDGCYATLIPIITFQIASLQEQKSVWGTVLFFQSFSLLLGPPTAGWIFQFFQTYKVVFYINGFPLVIASSLVLLIAILEKKKATSNILPFMSSSTSKLKFGQSDWMMEYKNVSNVSYKKKDSDEMKDGIQNEANSGDIEKATVSGSKPCISPNEKLAFTGQEQMTTLTFSSGYESCNVPKALV